MQLSEHFTLQECMRSNTAARCGINNTPPSHNIPALKAVAVNLLEPIRAHYSHPIIFNGGLSWFRCEDLNSRIGGSPQSQHMKGEAVDIELPGVVANLDLARWCRANLEFDQLIMECYDQNDPMGGWVHISYRADGNRNEVLTYHGGGRYSEDLPAA